jgi:Protein of unknown function (DUF2800)
MSEPASESISKSKAVKRAILSASNLGAAALCPAKPRLEAGLPEVETEYSARGTRLHPYFKTSLDRSDLSIDDRDLLERADRLADEVIARFVDSCGLDSEEYFTQEHEVELHGIVPGHSDLILTWKRGDYACVLDLKSGVRPADEAPDNYQLACYALLQRCRRPFLKCCVAIIQPDAFGPRVTTAMYTGADMCDVSAEIDRIYTQTSNPNAEPVAGEKQCLYCKAKTICPAYREKFMQVETVGTRAISTLQNEELVRVHRAIQFANKIKQEVSDELRVRIENGSLPGKLRSTGSTRSLSDPNGLWQELFIRYGTRDGFATEYDACRKLSFEAFEALIQRMEGCTQKRAKEIAKELSDPFVTSTPKAKIPILE